MPATNADAVDQSTLKTLPDLARAYGHNMPDAKAMTFEGEVTTYGEFDALTNQVANALIEAGIKPGERIAHVGKNSDLFFQIWVGACKVGAVLVPVNWRLAPPEIAFLLQDSGSRIVFSGPENLEIVQEAARDSAGTVVIPIEAEGGYAAMRDKASDQAPEFTPDPDDTALQLYTSGTTGRPKGALLSHKALLAPYRRHSTTPWFNWTSEDATLLAMPVGHIAGCGWGLIGLMNGAHTIIIRDFDPGVVLNHIEKDGVSRLFLVPSALQFVVDHPRAREIDYSRLKHTLYGASPIPVDLLRQGLEIFQCDFVQMYGLTETSGGVVYLPPEDHDPKGNERMKGVGISGQCAKVKILDEDRNECPPGEIGEIAILSESNMSGYWNREEATRQAFTSDGWFLSGDAGARDEDGYIYLKDRVKDMIISGGENVYPVEVENVLFGHPDIAQVAIVGVPDEKWGEAVKACVVLKDVAELDEAAIIAYAKERMAAFKAPKSVDFLAALPLNPSGKILKRALREPYWEGHDRRIA